MCSSVESTQVVALFRSDAFSVVRMVCVCVCERERKCTSVQLSGESMRCSSVLRRNGAFSVIWWYVCGRKREKERERARAQEMQMEIDRKSKREYGVVACCRSGVCSIIWLMCVRATESERVCGSSQVC